MNLWLFAPATPPFRSNISVLLEASSDPLPRYAADLARRQPELKAALDGAQHLRIAGHPALVMKGAPDHPKLKLKNVQVLIDVGDRKLFITGTALAERFDEFQKTFQGLLDSAEIVPRRALDYGKDAVAFRDIDGRFAMSVPPRFLPQRPRGGENALLVGPVEAGMHVVLTIDIVNLPKRWAASDDRLSELRRPTPGERTGQALLDGKVLKRAGQKDALEVLYRYYFPTEVETRELVIEVPWGDQLVRGSYKGPADGWNLYDAALRRSLETLVAPAPATVASPAPPR